MNKKIIFSFFASLLFLSQAAKSEVKIGTGTLAFNVGVNSNYVSRGYDQNKSSPAPFVGADFNIPVVSGIGFYLGTWISENELNAGANKEYDIYGGINKSFGPTTFDIGYIVYKYPSVTDKSANNAEYYLKINVAPEKSPISFGGAYYVDDTNGVKSSGKTFDDNYVELYAAYDFGVAKAKYTYGVWNKDTETHAVTFSKSIYDVDFALTGLSVSKAGDSLGTATEKDFVILNVTKTF